MFDFLDGYNQQGRYHVKVPFFVEFAGLAENVSNHASAP